MARIIDGKAISEKLVQRIAKEVEEFKINSKLTPALSVIMIGEDAASKSYVNKKIKVCKQTGIKSLLFNFPSDVEPKKVYNLVNSLNNDDLIHGILLQLPIPSHLNKFKLLELIDPNKDVDGFHPYNIGLLSQNRPLFLPCTPYGIQVMLRESNLPIEGKHIVVINRSDIVGKPLASMLMQNNGKYTNATVTICHDKTKNDTLKNICNIADIIVVAVGIPNFLTAEFVNLKHIIIDVGINRVGNKIVGDTHPEVHNIVDYITPVPGGVGPMTVAMLMENTLKAAKCIFNKKES